MPEIKKGIPRESTTRRCDDLCLFVPIQLLTENYELISGDPSDRIGRPKSALEPLTHGHQQIISHLMAERIVDGLEIVEIDEEDRHNFRGSATPDDGMFDSFEQQYAIGQPGEGIVERSLMGGLRSQP